MKIAFYGSSLVSAYWNGAATYYRGMIRALAGLGYSITFYEPDIYGRQQHRDIDPPDWAKVVVYPGTPEGVATVARDAAEADIVIKALGVGYADNELMDLLLAHARFDALTVFWDVDAPATLADLQANPAHPLRRALPRLGLVLTYGGGEPVIDAYRRLGAPATVPIYNAADPETHHPVPADPDFAAHLSFLGNRLPDREARVDDFFFQAAAHLPNHTLLLGGAGWETRDLPANVRYLGHVPTALHNRFNASALAVLNIARDSMAKTGFSPATRVFEAAAAGACIITDAWEGVDQFFSPGTEILIARDGADVAEIVGMLTPERARAIGDAALARVLADHTYVSRARDVDRLFRGGAHLLIEAAE